MLEADLFHREAGCKLQGAMFGMVLLIGYDEAWLERLYDIVIVTLSGPNVTSTGIYK